MSLFQIDFAEEAEDGQKPAFFLAKELRRRGYSVHYVVQRGSSSHQKAAESGRWVIPLKVKNSRNASSVFRLYLAMKRWRCRLVDVHDIRSAALGFAAASLARVPLRIVSGWKELSGKEDEILRRKYIQHVDAITVVSEGMKKRLIDGGFDSRLIQVIPDGVDFTPFTMETSKDYLRQKFSFGPDDFLIGMVANLADEKGLNDLIRVNKYLKEQAPHIRVVILGEGKMVLQKTRQMKEIEGENLFFCMGFQEDLPRILHSLDVFVLSSDQEGTGTILLDAMACRLPVIVTKSGGIPKLIADGKTGLVVPSGRPKSIVQAILKIYQDQNMALQMGQRSYEFVSQKFSVEAMASRIIDVYEDLARKREVKLGRAV